MNPHNNLLLRALKLNALFSGFSALCMFIASRWLALQFGLDGATYVYVVAGCLAIFAAMLANIVRTRLIRPWEIISIIAGDIVWVVASVALVVIFHELFTPTAVILVDLVAIAVSVFAVMQISGLRQYRKLADQS